MSDDRGRTLLTAGIAAVLRYGTVVAIAFIGAGYALSLSNGAARSGARSALELLSEGGSSTLITIGLLTLTLIPVVMAGVAASGFVSLRERRMASASLLVLVLLVGALGTALVLALAG